MVLFIVLLFFSIITLLICGSLLIGVFGVPFVPTPKKVFRVIEKENLIHDGQRLYELGCGDAIFLRYFASRFTVEAKGCELVPLFYLYGQIYVLFHRLLRKKSNVTIEFKNFFSVNISDKDIVYCYLLPKYLYALTKQFQTMKKGSKIISYDFEIKDMKYTKSIPVPKNHMLYIYER